MRMLVQYAVSHNQWNVLDELLVKMQAAESRDGRKSLESAALQEILSFDARLPRLKDAHASRSAPATAVLGKTRSHTVISSTRYHAAWSRTWEIQGPALSLPPSQASRILQNLIYTTRSGHLNEESRQIPALIHLLKLAGVESHHELALDVLVQATHPRLVGIDPATVNLPDAGVAASFEHIFLVFELLLKHRVITPAEIREFRLQEIMAESEVMSIEAFHACLGQALLRVAIRCYTKLRILDRAQLLLRYLRPMEEMMGPDEQAPSCLAEVTRSDRELFHTVCWDALSPAFGKKWLSSTSLLLVECVSGILHVWGHEPATSGHGAHEGQVTADDELLHQFFESALPGQVHAVPVEGRSAAGAALVLKALRLAGIPQTYVNGSRRLLPVLQALACPGQANQEGSLAQRNLLFNRVNNPGTEALGQSWGSKSSLAVELLEISRQLWHETTIEELGAANRWATRDANAFLNALLQAFLNGCFINHRLVLAQSVVEYYQQLSLEGARTRESATFAVFSRNLVPLVQAMHEHEQALSSPNHDMSLQRSACQDVITSFIASKRTRRMELTADAATAVAEAHLVIDQPGKATQALDLLLRQHQIPTRGAIRVFLQAVAREYPSYAGPILKQMCDTGYKPDVQTVEDVVVTLHSDAARFGQHVVTATTRHSLRDERTPEQVEVLGTLKRRAISAESPFYAGGPRFNRAAATFFGRLQTMPQTIPAKDSDQEEEVRSTQGPNAGTSVIPRQHDVERQLNELLVAGLRNGAHEVCEQLLHASERYHIPLGPQHFEAFFSALLDRNRPLPLKVPTLLPLILNHLFTVMSATSARRLVQTHYARLRMFAVRLEDATLAQQIYELGKRAGIDVVDMRALDKIRKTVALKPDLRLGDFLFHAERQELSGGTAKVAQLHS